MLLEALFTFSACFSKVPESGRTLYLQNKADLQGPNLCFIIDFFKNLMKAKKTLRRKFHTCTYTQNFNTMLKEGVIIKSTNPREITAIPNYMEDSLKT